MSDLMRSTIGYLLLIALLPLAQEAAAEVSERDLQVAARTLGFLDPPIVGENVLGIVYDPEIPSSLAEANSIESLLGDGLKMGGLTLRPQLIPKGNLTTSKVDIYFITEYLGDSANLIPSVLHDTGKLCLTVDLEQVRSGNCIVGIKSSPRIEIFVNRLLAEYSNIRFSSVFRVMITEI